MTARELQALFQQEKEKNIGPSETSEQPEVGPADVAWSFCGVYRSTAEYHRVGLGWCGAAHANGPFCDRHH
jgi:hypothetical protein